MRHFTHIIKTGALFALTALMTLTACSTYAHDTDEDNTEPLIAEETENISLVGTWHSNADEDSVSYEAVISKDADITVYQKDDGARYLYWNGSFPTSVEAYTITGIDSVRTDNDTETIRTDEDMKFTLHSDGQISFECEDTDEDGDTVNVYLHFFTEVYATNYIVSPIPSENPDSEPSADVSDGNVNNNTGTAEEPVQSEETAQNDIPADENANNSADVQPAESDVNTDSNTEGTPAADSNGYTYTDKSETKYASLGLNVRSGPSTAYGIIGSYEKGDAVTVTGTCNETGWARVDINGTTGYVDANYLTDTAPAVETTQNTAPATSTAQETQSTQEVQVETYVSGGFPLYKYSWNSYLGRVRIPSVGVNVAIYNNSSQNVCDAVDSACLFYAWDPPEYGNYTINLADHNNQGFNAIKNCTIGTVMYIDAVDGNTYKYVCDRIDLNGRNDLLYLYDSAGNSLDMTGGIWAYTCNQDWYHVSLVHFSAV